MHFSFAALLLLQSLAHAQSAPSSLQVVTVGENEKLRYSPESITAAVGSQVEFQFYGPTHSVVQGSFDEPCSAYKNGTGFFAGFMTNGTGPNPTTFTITINDTNPIWYFCLFPGHCQAGMVGVINPPSNTSETLAIFRANAADTSKSTSPAQQQGGLFGPFVAAANSGATPSAPAASSTAAITSASSAVSSASAKPSTITSGSSQMRIEFAALGGIAIAAAALMIKLFSQTHHRSYKMAITGHCLCKAVTYSIDAENPNAVAYDHCDDCQRYTALFAIFPKDKVSIMGPTKSFVIKGGSGLDVSRTFCSECGSGIAQSPNAAPDIIAMNGGGLESAFKKTLKPDTEFWTDSKLPFCSENLTHAFARMPPPQ
ncbi:hypothetical protein OIDMADRAFT_61774 [Oidiodendron maius Zn]|uniref:CENP-V/GFA domain-containing protein n=1 Tax=Oidiodendron maius (strain Zn) TaxID=913774 RepID=A0A0C3CU91_OIDMZ|nr:hypothetical protein OIDMADRAFT_61774 [Oidiodendron maius Zn]